MCGIAGQIAFSNAQTGPEMVSRMISALNHRGPESTGIYECDGAALGHARLSIIDIPGGAQPLSNEDGSLWITFNGEIFNYRELRAMLEARGHRFATRSDTEVIVHLFEDEGEACVHQLNGQWAFAIWNQRTRQLFLSRDRAGVRPLFYTHAPDSFLFASEIKGLFQHPGVRREIDIQALDQIFTLWVSLPPRTAFEGIHELPPGHSLWWSSKGIEIRQYWQYTYNSRPSPSVEASSSELLELLTTATQLRLRADVLCGAYLSGGLDSTLITALAQQASPRRLNTFSVGFDQPEFDESSYQQLAADFLGTDHHHLRCTAADIQSVFPAVIRHTEKPILRTAPAPMYLLAKLVHQAGLKVVITGEGADEMFGGYDIFKETKIRRFWAAQPASKLRPLLLRKLYPYLGNIQAQPDSYLRAFFHIQDRPLFFSHQPRWDLTSRLKLFFSHDLRERLARLQNDVSAQLQVRVPTAYRSWNWLNQAQYLEAAYLMPGYILSSQGDRMSMAHAVETRFPFLDPHVVDFASQLPPELKMKVLNEKFLLKQAARHLIPEAIRVRSKQPYRAPEADCFFRPKRAEFLDELLSPAKIEQQGLFHPGAVAQLIRKFESGTAISVKDNMAMVGIVSTALLQEEFCKI
jgi:asparagine synthase (glutamine-hydrolysing)